MTLFFPYFVPLSQKEKIYDKPENTHVLNGLNHPTYLPLKPVYLQRSICILNMLETDLSIFKKLK